MAGTASLHRSVPKQMQVLHAATNDLTKALGRQVKLFASSRVLDPSLETFSCEFHGVPPTPSGQSANGSMKLIGRLRLVRAPGERRIEFRPDADFADEDVSGPLRQFAKRVRVDEITVATPASVP